MKTKQIEYLVFAAVLFLGILHVLSFGLCLQDDSYIGLRYSRNIAEGHGPVFNPGEHVEGYTNFLWIILSTVPFAAGIDPILFTRIIGVLSALFAAFSVSRLAGQISRSRKASAAAAFLFVSLPFAMAEAAMGLETLLFTALVLSGFARYFLEYAEPDRSGLGSGIFLALAALTRPEGLAVGFFLLIIDLMRLKLHGRTMEISRQMKSRWIVFGLSAIAHTSFRWFYYGDIVPNTFHAKVGGGISALSRGFSYLRKFTFDSLLLVISGVTGAAVLIRICRDNRRFYAAVISLFLISYLVYVVYVGGDFKPTHRFFVLPSALFAVLAGSVFSFFVSRCKKRSVILLSFLILFVVAAQSFLLGERVREFARWRESVLPVHIAAGRWLGDEFPAGTLIATGNAGVVPFESNLPCIDMHGLCDRVIASRPVGEMGLGLPGHEKGDGLYVLSRHPDVILFMQSRFTDEPATEEDFGSSLFGISEYEMWNNPVFHSNYSLESVELEDSYFNFYLNSMQTGESVE